MPLDLISVGSWSKSFSLVPLDLIAVGSWSKSLSLVPLDLISVIGGSGSKPFSRQVSTAPVNISSKLYLNSNPKSLIFLEEK